jgi:hypothetical protein
MTMSAEQQAHQAQRPPHQLWLGRPEPPAEPVELTAGPVTALLHEGDLRHVRIGDVEIAQRIYVAVRDDVWNTIPGEITDLDVRAVDGGFAVDFDCRHRYQDIDFAWHARIRGDRDGVITYEMAGSPLSAFRYAKIGLNVHHPLSECVGRPFRAHTGSGELTGTLPVDIEPQLIVDGKLTALFPEYDALAIELEDGLEVRFDFEGDLFEMQDHRNWTDANLKSYGTPLSRPWPFDAQPGQELCERVCLSLGGTLPPPAPARDAIRLTVGGQAVRPLPPIGLGLTAGHGGLSDRQVELLRAVRPDHLRVDLVVGDPQVERDLAHGVEASRTLGAPLELGIFTTEDGVDGVRGLAMLLERERVDVVRVFVFAGGPGFSATDGSTTPASLVSAVRERLQGVLHGVPFTCGTNQFFTELNRNRPETDGVDGVVYSMNPQIHAADDLSLMENLEPQAETVRMTRKLGAGLPVFVSPVTLIGRSGPFPGGPPEPDDLPGNIDVRQASLFCAAWTVGSIKQLAASGAASITYFETTGHRGIVESEDEADLDPRFPSRPGDAFPVYHVFADLADVKPADVVHSESADPRSVELVALRSGEHLRVLVANLTQRPQTVVLSLPEPGPISMRMLDASSAPVAIADPVVYRVSPGDTPVGEDGTVEFTLEPFAVCRIDTRQGSRQR